jgi:nucleotide-binding universal stress UspA family protein
MKKILVAYDGSDPAKRALEQAAELAQAMGARLTIVSVVPIRPRPSPADPWDDTITHADELAEAKALLATRKVECDLLEPPGDPAQTIEQIAEEGAYDMVILGSRGLGTAQRLVQGSVSEHVARHAKSTIVIVH